MVAVSLSYITLALYSIAIILIFFYSIAQLNLLINYIKGRRKAVQLPPLDISDVSKVPYVTIQLPLYNEKYVTEGLLRCISKMEYPREKLEIQVLDDSTDDSVETTTQLIEEIARQGIDIKHITRTNRKGFKAGALKEGMEVAKGDFIAIFDADFLPQKDWLLSTMPYFNDDEVGVVQTRWGHINRDYSLLTKIQAFALDAHFTIEQVGRNSRSHFINFNGTAGVWRKQCIYDAGNWEADTLTEDLDLSYRAQLKKWKFRYLEHIETPAELPAVISASRSQQFRWNKGGAENLRKMTARVLSSETINWKTKFHGILHLLNSSMFLFVFIMAILSVPVLFIKNTYAHLAMYFNVMMFFVVTSIIFFVCYWTTFKNIRGGGFKNFMIYTGLFFTFYSIALGFSFHNTIAVLEGLWGKKSEFVRTPKFNLSNTKKKSWKENTYLSKKIPKNVIIEGLLALYFVFALYSGYLLDDFALWPFHLMLLIGYSYMFVQSIAATSK
ncbi:MAG: glycosyltransferase [Flavobacteriales bacterium]|nr:glycosyltransferase [Flavobacteriales bacterium]